MRYLSSVNLLALLATLSITVVPNASALTSDSSSGLIIPSGAILYFDKESCPPGYSHFDAGVGRILVADGRVEEERDYRDGSWSGYYYDYPRGRRGGHAMYRLTDEVSWQHAHHIPRIVTHNTGQRGWGVQSNTAPYDSTRTGTGMTGGSGGEALPYDNRMPYVALRMCVKD